MAQPIDEISSSQSSLVTMSLDSLPVELLLLILERLPAKDLLGLRLVSSTFRSIVDDNQNLWARVSVAGIYPATIKDACFLERLAKLNNIEALFKMAVALIYNDGPPESKQGKHADTIEANAMAAASYLRDLEAVAPQRMAPVSWLLIRPPWSYRQPCCKATVCALLCEVFKDQQKDLSSRSVYSLGKSCLLLNTLMRQSPSEFWSDWTGLWQPSLKDTDLFEVAASRGCPSSAEELFCLASSAKRADPGRELFSLRRLRELALSAKYLDPKLALCKVYAEGRASVIPENMQLAFIQEVSLSAVPVPVAGFLERLQLTASNSDSRITPNMRYILVDWLVDVAREKDFPPLVIHVAVRCVDRWLCMYGTSRKQLQLLGITCFLLASRYFMDVEVITVREAAWMTDNSYQYSEVVRMLAEVLAGLKGCLRSATIIDYLVIYLPLSDARQEVWHYAHYVADVSLLDTRASSVRPSEIAAACLILAQLTVQRDQVQPGFFKSTGKIWPSKLVLASGLELKQLSKHIRMLLALVQRDSEGYLAQLDLLKGGAAHSERSVYDRYSWEDKYCVSKLEPLALETLETHAASWSRPCLTDDCSLATAQETAHDRTHNRDDSGICSMLYSSDDEHSASCCEGSSADTACCPLQVDQSVEWSELELEQSDTYCSGGPSADASASSGLQFPAQSQHSHFLYGSTQSAGSTISSKRKAFVPIEDIASPRLRHHGQPPPVDRLASRRRVLADLPPSTQVGLRQLRRHQKTGEVKTDLKSSLRLATLASLPKPGFLHDFVDNGRTSANGAGTTPRLSPHRLTSRSLKSAKTAKQRGIS